MPPRSTPTSCVACSPGAERLDETLAAAAATAARFDAPLRARVDAGATRTGELGAQLRDLGAAEVALRQGAEDAAQRATEIEIELTRIEGEAADARSRLGEAGAETAEGDDRDELAARAERLEQRRIQLGQVNPLAKEEYDAEKERLAELEVQREDLEQSLKELAELRDELAETVERRFAETFQAVAEHFEDVAATLFPGGEGRLRLVEPEEEGGETGVEVELRPAGKRITRLGMLSGGEKALGAISFLFALFLAKPCPFYLLDEVEAALDDANIGRFVELLRRYADRAQFVVITHQKRTMEAADVLYGVTMGGDGVSQIVSRRLPREDAASRPPSTSARSAQSNSVLGGQALRRLDEPRVDQPFAHLVLVDVLEPDQRGTPARPEVRRQAVGVRVRRDEQRPLLAVAARPHRAFVARREAGELLSADRERRLPPRSRLLDLGQLPCELGHPLPRDHALRLTFRADGEKLVRAPGRRGGPGGDRRGAAGLLRPAPRLARQEPARAHRRARRRDLRSRQRRGLGAARGGADPGRRRRPRHRRARPPARGAERARRPRRRRSRRRSRTMLGEPGTLNLTATPSVILVVGVNGTGKTTTIGKLAQKLREHGRTVLLGAADTWRAAAEEQLEIWAERAEADFVGAARGADPAAVAYDAVEAARARGKDVAIVDTAGRLHTQSNLMEELAKVRRVIEGRLEGAPHETLLVVDATTGQNGLQQARLFGETVGVTGVALTKLDGSAKGGIAVAIAYELGLPVKLIGVGEGLDDLRPFDPQDFARALVSG